jgi:hypothetical protein
MTYHSDPARWTHSPGEAPELLRSSLEAAGREGPSEHQMQALALKLAAFGAGAALAAGAASAKASTTATGTGLAATGSSVLTKAAMSVALVGAIAAGGALLVRQPARPMAHETAAAHQVDVTQPQGAQPEGTKPEDTHAERARLAVPPSGRKLAPTQPLAEAAPAVEPARSVGATPGVEPSTSARSSDARAELSRSERRERRHARAQAAQATEPTEGLEVAAPVAPSSIEVVQVEGRRVQPSEIDLLSRARSALASRPREAYRLTEEHKSTYAQGLFAQERDALAVEALQRAGDLKRARQLAEAFLQRYPSSPAAHRFRETMGLP